MCARSLCDKKTNDASSRKRLEISNRTQNQVDEACDGEELSQRFREVSWRTLSCSTHLYL